MNRRVHFLLLLSLIAGSYCSSAIAHEEQLSAGNKSPNAALSPDSTSTELQRLGIVDLFHIENNKVIALREPSKDPWEEYTQVQLRGKVREIVETSEKIEVLVPYDRDNPEHIRKKKAQETKREDLLLLGQEPEYYRYLLPPAELTPSQFQKAKGLLLGQNAYLEFGSGPRFSGLIHGPRYVIRLRNHEQQLLVTISQINLPSIWFSGVSIAPFGGLLHPAIESEWHQIIEERLVGAENN